MTTKRAFWLDCGARGLAQSPRSQSGSRLLSHKSEGRRRAGAGRGSGRQSGLFLARKRHSARSLPKYPTPLPSAGPASLATSHTMQRGRAAFFRQCPSPAIGGVGCDCVQNPGPCRSSSESRAETAWGEITGLPHAVSQRRSERRSSWF
jgi:hypothetical protein